MENAKGNVPPREGMVRRSSYLLNLPLTRMKIRYVQSFSESEKENSSLKKFFLE